MVNKILEVKEITKIYQGEEKPSLDKVSFDVLEGEFIGIMGASGSGKTTLLNIISTIDKPSSGEVFIKQKSINSLKKTESAKFRKENIGFIFQEYLLLDSLTIFENIAVPLTLYGYSKKRIEEEVNELAKRFGIYNLLTKYPGQLSGGQKQRVSAARAIVKEPTIIFADEPTGALDSTSSTELLDLLSECNSEFNSTIMMVTHDAYAASFTKRILIFKDGKIINEILKGEQPQPIFYEQILRAISNVDLKKRGGL